jgi:hypothetical protein
VVSIKNTIIEMCGYSHGVVLTNIIAANISGIGCWDSVIAQVGVLIGPGCSENIVNAYVNPGTYPAVLDISGNANEIHTNGTVYVTGNGGVVSKTLVTSDAQVTNFLFVNVITSPGTSGYYIPSNNLASWLYAPGQVVGVGLPALKLFGSSPFTSGTYYAYGSTGGGSTTAFYDLGNGNEEDSILGWVGNGKGLTNIPASGVSTNGAPAGVSVVTSSNGVSQWLALPPGGSGAKLNVENFGAVHNGLIFTNASISSNSYTLTISGQTVTSADIGKRVFVYGAGYTNNNGLNGFPTYDLESAISNVTGGTTIILSNKAGTTVSTAWGVYGTDDTAAVQAGINAASTNGTQWHFTNTTLFFPDGIYIVDGPLVNVGTNSTNYLNAQLTVPYVPYSGIYGPTIKLRGATRPGQTYAYNWNTMGANGAMIWSTLVQSTVTNARMFSTANLTNTAGSPPRSTPQTPFNNNCVDIENMSFRMPHNSPATVLDMTGANQTHIEHVLIDEGYYPYSSPATNTWGYIKDQNATAYASSAISLPNTSEGSVVVNDITVMDAFIGLNYGDDASMHNLLFFDCVYGMFSFNKGAGHNSHAHDVICAQCLNVIGCDRLGFSYSCDLELTGLDMENGYGSLPFNVLNSIIDDPDSLAGGSVEVEDNWGSAAPATPTIGAGCWSISVTPAYNGSGNPFTTWNLWTGKSYLTKQNFRAGIQSSYYRQTNFFGGAGDAGDFYFGPNDGAAYQWYFGGDSRAAMQSQVSRNGFDWYLSNQALGARTNLMHLDTNGNLTSELSIAAGGDVTAGNILHGTKGMDANGATISNSLVLWQTNIGGSGLIIAQTNGNSYTTLSMVNYDINSGGTNAATSWQWRVLNSSNNNNCTMSLEVNTPGAGDTNAFTLNPIARLVTWATWAWTNNAGFGVLNGQVYDYGETTINGGTTNNALGFVGNGLGITNIQSTNLTPNAGKFTNSFTASLNTNTYFLWGTNQIITLSITPPVGTIYTFVMRNYNGSAVITNNGSVFTVPGTGTTTNSVNIGAWNSPSNTWTGAYDGSNW